MSLEKSKIQEIVTLHQEIAGHLRLSLDKAIKIGGLLTEQKKNLSHGEFIPWIKAKLPFSDRTAQNYMRIYKQRDKLKNESVSYLGEAYKLLEAPKPEIEGPEARKLKEHDNALMFFRAKLEALKMLAEKTNKMADDPFVSVDDKVHALHNLANKATILSNKVTEIKLQGERELGRVLNELEGQAPSVDWLRFMNDNIYSYKIIELLNRRILAF